MGYRNLTCHHLRSDRLSLPLSQRIHSCISLVRIWPLLLWAILSKMPRFPTIVAVQAVFCQMTRLATVLTILTVSGYMASFFAIIASWWIITITKCRLLHLLQSGHCSKFCRACLLPPNCSGRPWFLGPLFLLPPGWGFPLDPPDLPWLLGFLVWNPNLLPLRGLYTCSGLGCITSFNPSLALTFTFFSAFIHDSCK